jgi:ABC-2 type transport system ATP-binding protein
MQHTAGIKGMFKDLLFRQHTSVEAVRGISFSIKAGECVGFIGPNGAGKTTTIKMLAGLLMPTSGDIQVNGHLPGKRSSEFLRTIGVVMGQRSQLWWELDARSALHLVASAYRVPEQSFEARVASLAQVFDVAQLLNTPVRNLSLGERMKLEIIASLIHSPSVLFLDEPTLGLDLVSQRRLREFIVSCNRELGVTVLMTSHYLADIESVCRRTIIIVDGKIVFDGDLQSLRSVSQMKRVSVAGGAHVTEFTKLGLVWSERREEWTGTVSRTVLSQVLGAAISNGLTNLSVQDPPLEDVIALIYEEGGAAIEVPR